MIGLLGRHTKALERMKIKYPYKSKTKNGFCEALPSRPIRIQVHEFYQKMDETDKINDRLSLFLSVYLHVVISGQSLTGNGLCVFVCIPGFVHGGMWYDETWFGGWVKVKLNVGIVLVGIVLVGIVLWSVVFGYIINGNDLGFFFVFELSIDNFFSSKSIH